MFELILFCLLPYALGTEVRQVFGRKEAVLILGNIIPASALPKNMMKYITPCGPDYLGSINCQGNSLLFWQNPDYECYPYEVSYVQPNRVR